MSGGDVAGAAGSMIADDARGLLSRWLRATVREPLVVFGLVAIGLFALDAARSGPDSAPENAEHANAESTPVAGAPPVLSRRIVVTGQLVGALREEFTWLEGRPPTEPELDRLIDRWIEDEMLFQEGLTMQLHRWDTKVRERVVNRVRMLWAKEPATPDEPVLLDYYVDNLDFYRSDARVVFDHLHFESLDSEAEGRAILAALRRGETPAGDPFWLGEGRQDHGESVLRAAFGGAFLASLKRYPRGEWTGPIASPRGVHFVRPLELVPGRQRPYAEVRDQVLADWSASERRGGVRDRLDEIAPRYTIVRAPERFQ